MNRRGTPKFVGRMVFVFVLGLWASFWGATIYTAVHFIRKYW